MKKTAHSEYGHLTKVLIKPALNAFISDEKLASEWQNLYYLQQPSFQKSLTEYNLFESLFPDGVEKLRLSPNPTLSIDSIYCRDAAIATDFGMVICRMGKPGRIDEPEAERLFFEANNIPVLGSIKAPGTLEGGDVAWLDEKTLAVGHTYRTNDSGIAQLKALLEPRGVEVVVADMPHFRGPSDILHLMSILSPVDRNLAVVYSPLMPIAFRKLLLNRGFELVEVPEQEYDSMGCNVLALGPRQCLMVAGNPVTQQRLKDAGCEVITYPGTEISVKGCGGPTCLTRPIERKI